MPRAAILDRNQSLLERFEEREARRVAAAYRQARAEIVERLMMQYPTGIQTPEQAAAAVRQLGLLGQIDARLLELERELHVILRDVVNSSSELAIEQIRREISLLPAEIRPTAPLFSTINHQMIERFLPVAVQDAALATRSLSLQLQRELQTGLLQGASFPSLVKRLMAATPTGEGPAVWHNGALSAERMVRRSTITAENSAKQASLQETQREIPEVRKQAIATMGKDTTDCCLRVHGQIQPVDQPFVLTGTPRFADEMMVPSFHWNCRTSVTMYHPVFEQSGLTTVNMRKSANAELARREGEKQAKAAARPEPVRIPKTIDDAKTVAEVQAWAKQKYQHITWEIDNTHIETIQPTVRRFDQMAQQWPDVAKRVEYVGTRAPGSAQPFDWNNNNHWAHATYDGKVIGLNPKYYNDPKSLQAGLDLGVSTGFHPKGCNTVESIMTHEFGHQVENYLLTQNKAYFTEATAADGTGIVADTVRLFNAKNSPTAKLSTYAITTNQNPLKPEGWAEGIAAIHHTPKSEWPAYVQRLKKLLDTVGDPSKWTVARDVGNIPTLRDLSGDARQRAIDELSRLRKELNLT